MYPDPNDEMFNPPGLLIGPLPHIKRVSFNKFLNREIVTYVPDYKHDGVQERVATEVDYVEACCGRRD